MRPQKFASLLVPQRLKPQARQIAWAFGESLGAVGIGSGFHQVKSFAPEVYERISASGMPPNLRRQLIARLSDQMNRRTTALDSSQSQIVTDVLYVAGGLAVDAIKDAIALRQNGLTCTLLVPPSASNRNADLVRDHNVDMVEYEDLWELVYLLMGAQAPITIARRGNAQNALLAMLFGPGKTIYKPYDFVVRYPWEVLPEFFPNASHHLAEAFILERTDGLMHFHEESAMDFVRSNFGFHGKAIQMRPGCMDEFSVRPGLPKLSAQDGQIHIVYAAGLARKSTDSRMVGDSDHYDEFVSMLEQGLHLHVYIANRKSCDGDDDMGHYFQLADRYTNYHLENTIPYAQLVHELTLYDFAYSYFDTRNRTVRMDEFNGGISNGFYTYLDAGLPVICSESFWAMADEVRMHGMGFVLKPEDVSGIGETLRDCDYDALVNNIAAARPALMYDSENLVRFVKELSEK